MRARLLAGLALCTVLLGGCASSDTPSQIRYSMIQDLEPSMMSGSSNVKLQLNPALDGGGIVLQVSDHSLREARFHRWAEPLDSQLTALVNNALVSEKFRLKGQILNVYVSRFQGSEAGKVYVSAAFSLMTPQGNTIKTSNRQLEALQEAEGYEALVASLRSGFDRVCHEALIDLN
ncbi:MAG: membrane integrity-associated transporter subunit PqiC [Succinivibrio sp.]|nr:membrane integrity-associated transporter subunit PqiC [Succinivibrio sp.]